MKNKKLLSAVLALVMMFSVTTTSFATIPEYGEEYQAQPTKTYTQKFHDVTSDYWAFNYIMEMNERGVLSGYPNGYFYPENTITRAEFSKIMCLAAGLTVTPVTSTSYADVSTSDWFAPYVECGRYYLSGYIADGLNYYLPNDNALREDIAVALVKLKGYDTSLYDESILKAMFTDWQSISQGARKYVSVAVEQGLISGYEDNTFRGQNTITRAEASTLLWRAYQYGNGNKVFEKEELSTPAPTLAPTPKPTTVPTATATPSPTPVVTAEPTPAPTNTPKPTPTPIPEPEYLYELKTIATNVKNVEGMIATDDGIIYLDGNNIMEVKKDANKAIVLHSIDEVPYLGNENLPKSELQRYLEQHKIISISVKDDCIYGIVREPGQDLYLYNFTDASLIYKLAKLPEPIGTTFYLDDMNYIYSDYIFVNDIKTNYISVTSRYFYKTYHVINNKLFLLDGDNSDAWCIYFMDNRTGEWKRLDYIKNGNVITANNKFIYSRTSEGLYTIDENGDSDYICGIDDINNTDGKPIQFNSIQRMTSVVDSDGTIYYWDINYNSIRQLSRN